MSNQNPAGPPPLPNTLPRPIGKNFLDPRIDGIDLTYYETTFASLAPAATADAAIEQVRKGPGTFVAVLARGFRPRTHYTGPRDTAQPTVIRAIP